MEDWTKNLELMDQVWQRYRAAGISRREFLRFLAASAGTVAAGAVLAACGPTAAPPAPATSSPTTQAGAVTGPYGPSRPMVIVSAQSSDTPTVDPAIGATVSGGLEIIWNVYDTLVAYKDEGQEIVPALATSWEASPDGKTYTFKLRQGVKYHNGETFNANEVKYSLERIRGLKDLPASYWGPCDSIDVVDEYTVRMNMKYPYGPWLSVLAGSRGMYMGPPKKSVEEHKTADDPWAAKWFQTHENGTGPWILDEWARDTKYSYKRFPGYWQGWAGTHADKPVVLIVKDSATNRLMLEKGDLDIGGGPPLFGKELKNNPDIEVRSTPSFQLYYVTMNTQLAPTDNKLVRQAIAYAFDYQSCLNDIYFGFGDIGGLGPVPKTMWPFVKDMPPYTYNLEKAKQLLTQAGFPNGGFTLNTIMMDLEERRRIVELLQNGLKKLNIELKASFTTWPVNASTMGKPAKETTHHISGYSAWPSFPDPDDEFKPFNSQEMEGGLNWAKYNNPQVDKLLEQGRSTLDRAKREEIYTQVSRILHEDCPAIWVVQNNNIQLSRKWVKGFQVNPSLQSVPLLYSRYIEGRPAQFDHLT